MRFLFKDQLEPFSYLLYAIAIIIILFRSKKIRFRALLFYYLSASFLLLIACYTMSDRLNRIIYNVFFLVTSFVLFYYFNSILVNKVKKIVIKILFTVNLVFFIIFDVILGRLADVNNLVYSIVFISIVVYALLYFEQLIRNVNELNLLTQFDFWLVSGFLLYFFSSFFIVLFYDDIDINQRALLWALQNIILFLSSILTITGSLWIYYQKEYF